MNIVYKTELQIGVVISTIILLTLFYRIRYFEFDASGEVISLRTHHPVFRNYDRRTEFPKEKLSDFEVKKSWGRILIKIHLKLAADKKAVVYYSARGLDSGAEKALQISLQVTKNRLGNTGIN